jgi:hypothetical protein
MSQPEDFDENENENEDLLAPPSLSKRAPGKLATGANKANKTNEGLGYFYLELPRYQELSRIFYI